jgi:hypothetical protein
MIFAGLDLGQSIDHAGLVVAEAALRPLAVHVRHVHRYPTGTSYATILPDVARELTAFRPPVALSVDSRGPGKPCCDLLSVWPDLRLRRLLAVANTSGRDARRQPPRQGDPAFLERWNVPKITLFRTLTRLIKSGGFTIADSPQARLLKAEFSNFGVKLSAAGNLKLEAMTGHDDLLLATVILIWAAVTERAT